MSETSDIYKSRKNYFAVAKMSFKRFNCLFQSDIGPSA